MNGKTCNYYVTLRCNDTCEFCPIWQNEEYKKKEEAPCDLTILKDKGITHLNITGGEPLLRDDLPQLLRQARKLGFNVQLTTNGILYIERAKDLAGLIDHLYFSLDYPFAEAHDRSRGVECFHTVIKGIKHAQELGEKPIINFTLTRDSILYLPEMIELAEKLAVLVRLTPVADFYGSQGFARATIAHILYYFRNKNVLVNKAVMEFVKNGGNNPVFPRCRAKETTITILPDGSAVSPCFFNQNGVQGKAEICSSCMHWPYMLPSFATGLDKYFWLNLYSDLVARYKGD